MFSRTTLVRLFAVVVLLSMLAACTPAAPAPAAPAAQQPAPTTASQAQPAAPAASTAQITLRVQPESDFYAANASGGALAYRAAHEKFLKEHPNVKVELEVVPGFDRYKIFTVADEGGDPPDVTFQGAANTYTLITAGRVLPLNEYMQGHKWLNPENLSSAILDTETVNGKYYGIPTTTDCRVLYYRKDLFQAAGLDPNKPPVSRDDLIAYAQKLTKDTNGDGKIDQWGYGFVADNSLHTAHMFLTNVWAGGGDLVDQDGKAIYDSPAGQAAIQYYADLVNKYKVSPPEVISTDVDATVRGLVGGQYAMALLGSWSWPTDILAPLGADKVGWTKIPVPQGGRDATFSGGWSWMISSKTKHPKEAWEYIETMMSEDVALTLGKANISTWQSVLNNPEVKQTWTAQMGAYAAAAKHGNPQVATTQALFDGIRLAVQDAIQGKGDPATLLKNAAADYNSKYYKK